MTSEETLKTLSEAIDAYASAKVAGNESLVKFGIANLQQFLNGHVITPVEAPEAEAEAEDEA
jgi:hypothetical protein